VHSNKHRTPRLTALCPPRTWHRWLRGYHCRHCRLHAANLVVRAKPSVYLVAPDRPERERIVNALAGHVQTVITFDRGQDFLAHACAGGHACVVVVDLALPDMRALDFVVSAGRNLPVIVLGHADEVSAAVEMIRAGAADFLDRPFDGRRLRAAVRAATTPRQS
jgi:two-component system, LuxR family, response regulator FixJ